MSNATSNGHTRQPPADWRPTAIAGALLLATVLAAVVRLHQLGHGAFWLDELYTVNSVSNVDASHRSKMLGYLPTWMGLHLQGIDPASVPQYEPHHWRAMGIDEVTVRLPTAVIGILSVPIIGLLACRLLGARAGLIATFLLAIAPWHIYWSQAARFYVPQFLFYTLALLLYYGATRSGSRRTIALAMLMVVLAVMSQPTAIVIGLIFAVDWAIAAWRGRPVRLGVFGWTAAAAALGFCGALLAMDIGERPEQWTQFVTEPVRHQQPWSMILGAVYMIGPGVAALALLTAMSHGLRNGGRSAPPELRQPIVDDRMWIYFGAAAVLPVLVFALVSGWAFAGLRYSFICLFPWLALAAMGLDRMYVELRPRCGWMLAAAPTATIVAGLALLNQIYFGSGGNFHARWADATALVVERRAEGEAVAAGDPFLASYYLGEPALPLPESPQHVRELEQTTWFIVHATHNPARTGRFWLFEDAELIDVFALRAVHANSSVQVYRYVPQRSVE